MSTYYCLITNAGLAKLAAAQASGTPVTLSQFAVGDSGGVFYEPLATQLTLVSEEWRGAINRVFVSPNEATRIVVEALIPASVGGFDIREAGIIDADGDLFAVGKYPLTNKPAPGSGSEKDLYVRMILQVSNAATVTQTIDPSVVTLTQAALDALDWKNSCRAGTTGNVALSGGAPSTVDGVALAVNDRVLVKNQTTASQNGIYRVQTVGTGSNGTWVRATDADSAFDVTANLVVAVEQGTVNADSIWVLTTDGPITLGTTALTFACVYGQQDKASNHISLDNGHGGQTPKTLSGSTTNSLDASGHTHAISAASETVKGAVELATAAETTAGTDNTRAVHPAGLKVELDKKAPLASPTLTGVVTAGDRVKGGFGATSTTGVADWNDVSNAVSGQGPTLLLGTATNGPGPNRYFHAFTFEFSHKNGSGDMTQFAVPYIQGDPMYMRVRGSMTWGAWQPFVLADATQTLSNKTLASPTLTGVPATPTAAADTNTTQVASTAFVIGQAGTGAPGALSDGSAITGTSRKYSREDHRHPLTAASESTKGCVELATATETRTGTDNARAVHPAGLASMFNASNLVAGSGYVRIPDVSGGAIFQGGLTGTISSNGTLAVTFPAAFPEELVSVVAVPTVDTTSSENHIKVIAASTTGFTVQNYGTSTTAVRWMAIGK